MAINCGRKIINCNGEHISKTSEERSEKFSFFNAPPGTQQKSFYDETMNPLKSTNTPHKNHNEAAFIGKTFHPKMDQLCRRDRQFLLLLLFASSTHGFLTANELTLRSHSLRLGFPREFYCT